MSARVLPFPVDRAPKAPKRRRATEPTDGVATTRSGYGIWKLRYPVRGCECLIAVLADGEQIARVPIPHGADGDEIAGLLHQLLESVEAEPSAPRPELVR